MSKSAREMAMEALARTPEEVAKRDERERQRKISESLDQKNARRSEVMLEMAITKIMTVLKINAADWKVVEKHPFWVTLEDPEDDRIDGVKLTVVAETHNNQAALRVLYQPYSNWVGSPDYHSDRMVEWRGGPEVTSLLELGRLIRSKDDHNAAVSASMPQWLP